jgi:hypothetical protein
VSKAAASLPLVYFRCTELRATLSVPTCAAQYRTANGGEVANKRAGYTPHAHRTGCVECPIGKDHAKGKPTPPDLITDPPTLALVREPLKQKVCVACLKPFVPLQPRQLYCGPDCDPAFARAVDPAPVPLLPPPPEVEKGEGTMPEQEPARLCEHCQQPIPSTRSHQAVTCSQTCHDIRKTALERRRHEIGKPDPTKVYQDKPCVACGEKFTPVSNANRYCPACKAGSVKPTTAPNNQPLPEPEKSEALITNDPAFVIRETQTLPAPGCGVAEVERLHRDQAIRQHADDLLTFAQAMGMPVPEQPAEPVTTEVNVAREVMRALASVPGVIEVTRHDPKHASPEDVLRLSGFDVVGALDVPTGRLVVRRWNQFHAGSEPLLRAAGYRVTHAETYAGHVAIIVATDAKPQETST